MPVSPFKTAALSAIGSMTSAMTAATLERVAMLCAAPPATSVGHAASPALRAARGQAARAVADQCALRVQNGGAFLCFLLCGEKEARHMRVSGLLVRAAVSAWPK